MCEFLPRLGLNSVRRRYSDVQCVRLLVSVLGVYACIYVRVASLTFPQSSCVRVGVSNEALAVWRMLCNHANQHHAYPRQGVCYRRCRTPSKGDLVLADLLCTTVPVEDNLELL